MRCFSLLSLLLAAPAFAQAPGAKPTFFEVAAPFIDEHTLIVARADVARIDLDTLLKLFVAIAGEDAAEETVPAVKNWVKSFVASGGRDLFLTYGPGDFPNTPALIVPAPADRKARDTLGTLVQTLFKDKGINADVVTLHGCVCVGTKDSLAVLKARKPVDRPELKAAIEAGHDGVIQLAFALSAEARKIHEQVAPTLPTERGGGGIEKITGGRKWMGRPGGTGPVQRGKGEAKVQRPAAREDMRATAGRGQ